MSSERTFASDNFAGAHPLILDAIAKANIGHAEAYGYDKITKRTLNIFNEIFEHDVEVYFVFNGTAANVMSLGACVDSFGSVLCTETAHIHVDECGAPEKQLGIKLQTYPHVEGKLTVEAISSSLHLLGSEHHAQPQAISISQTTELGTIYTIEEIENLAEFAHKNGLYLHVDGARIANAVTASNISLHKMLVDTGVDVISFGGTKNGLLFGEAVVFLNKSLAKKFKYKRKQHMQLCSKMRFIAAQFEALLTTGLWLENAARANKMAKNLYTEIQAIPRIKTIYPVQANAIFAKLPANTIHKLQEKVFFWIWDENESIARWMTSFDTNMDDIMNFTKLLNEELIK